MNKQELYDLTKNNEIPYFLRRNDEQYSAQTIDNLDRNLELTKQDLVNIAKNDPTMWCFMNSIDASEILKLIDRNVLKRKYEGNYTVVFGLMFNEKIRSVFKQCLIDLILKLHCDLHNLSIRGESILTIVMKLNDTETFIHLLKKGMSPILANQYGNIPSMISAYNHQIYYLSLLKYFGDDFLTKNNIGLDVFEIAKLKNDYIIQELIENIKKS